MTTVDRYDVTRVQRAPSLLRKFNEGGVLESADVHTAVTLGRLVGEHTETVLLAAALAVRGPRLGHVCIDLDTVGATAVSESAVDVAALPWPGAVGWRDAVAASPLVASASDVDGAGKPLHLEGSRVYLDRYWRYEERVAAELRMRATAAVEGVDRAVLREGLDRLFPATGDGLDLQRLGAERAVLSRLAVIAGGPGTGKTTTIAAVLALLDDQAATAGRRQPRIALAAPTGKAADRVADALRQSADRLNLAPGPRERLLVTEPSTIHRLLRRHPGSHSRFRHDHRNPLPYDVVVVDETSMVSLPLMAKLLDAVPRTARMLLVGDPDQLASVEAGSVLGDLAPQARRNTPTAKRGGSPFAGRIVVLERVHRFAAQSPIAMLAAAVKSGDADRAIAALEDGNTEGLTWVRDVEELGSDPASSLPVEAVPAPAVQAALHILRAARGGDAAEALRALDDVRILCAHRRGPFGVATWGSLLERSLARSVPDYDPSHPWPIGRPLLVTRNDYRLQLYNGDTGVIMDAGDGTPVVAFAGHPAPRLIRPSRLEAVEPAHALTIHKSQGSEFHHVIVVLPDEMSRILTRELLYTAVTRARESLIMFGSEAAIRTAVTRGVQRASGLRPKLWGPESEYPSK